MPPQVWRQVSETWAARGSVGVLEPPAARGWRRWAAPRVFRIPGPWRRCCRQRERRRYVACRRWSPTPGTPDPRRGVGGLLGGL